VSIEEQQAIMDSFFCLRETRFGPVAVVWSSGGGVPRIRRVLLSRPGFSAREAVDLLYSDSIPFSCERIDVVCDRLVDFLDGKEIRFSLDVIQLDSCSSFQQKVLLAEHGIPRGNVSTYRRIAVHLGNLQGARAVGAALARNPFPLIVPCHRAIRTDGRLGGFQGGIEMKRALLEMEGILLDGSARVVSKKLFY